MIADAADIGRGGRVSVCECWARDGIQGWSAIVPTADKLRVIDAVAAAGIEEIDATSFLPAHTVPQLADAEDVLGGVPDGLRVRVLAVNVKGVERALEAHRSIHVLDAVGFPISASEPHNIANLRRDHESHLRALEKMISLCADAGVPPLMSVSTAFGCPIIGHVGREAVFGFVAWGVKRGVETIMLGDTTGMADPLSVATLVSEILGRYPNLDLAVHFHDNRGLGIVNTLAALEAGVGKVDASLGGTGGEPKIVEQGQAGELGNTCTEDLVAMLDGMGVKTSIDVGALLEAGRIAEDVLGARLRSSVLRAGRVATERR